MIEKHIKNIISSSELNENSVRANFAHTASDGKRYYIEKDKEKTNPLGLVNLY